jgi:tetratricopeptide (TPR) repeat protein
MHRSVHWQRLLLVLGVLVILSGGLYALNVVQSRRQASIIKSVAEKAESNIDGDKERRAEAIAHYETYLKFRPKDEVAAQKYAHLLLEQYKADPTAQNAGTTIAGVERFLRNFPDHPTERRDLAEILLNIGKVSSAREHIDMLFDSPRNNLRTDVELLEMRARCELVGGELSKAIEYLEEAIKTGKAPVRVYQQILTLLNSNKGDGRREVKIEGYIRTLLDEPFRNDIEARIAVARFRLFRREIENARGDIDWAMNKIAGGANNAQVLITAAELEIVDTRSDRDARAKLESALKLAERAFAVDPRNVEAGLFLAKLQAQLGDRDKAIATLQATASALAKKNDQYWVLLDHLIDLRNKEVSQGLLDRASAGVNDDARLMYFRGRLAMLDSEWMKAKELLEKAAPHLVKIPEHHKRALTSLGQIYGILQNPDAQLDRYRAALKDDATYIPALIGEAEALAKLNKYDESLTKYQVLVTAYQLEALRPTLARLRLVDLLRKPPENRNWDKFDSEDTLGPAKDRPLEIGIIHAEGLAARGARDKALEELKVLLEKFKNDPSVSAVWVVLARIQEAGRPEAALQLLEEAEKKIGDSVDIRLARADALLVRAKPPTLGEFESIGANFKKFTPADQYRLLLGIGQACLLTVPRTPEGEARKSMQDAAIHFLDLAAQSDPRDLHSRALLIDLALSIENKQVTEKTIAELTALEGPDGPISTLAKVVIRLPEVRKKIQESQPQTDQLKELRELINKVQKQRPGWGRVYVALGRLDDLEGLTEQAVEHYRQALKEGDREESVIRRAVQLLRERKQDAQAAALLDELSTKLVLPTDLERFRAIFEMLNRVVPRSERPTIDRIAAADSRDYRILLLRGELLAAIREEADALKAFRRAIEIDETIPEAWEALIRQLARTGDMAGARQALGEAERKLLPLKQKSDAARAELLIVLAGCHELLGDRKLAAERYQEAMKAAPKELNPNQRLVQFLIRTGQQAEADKYLYNLTLDPAPDLARWARRYRATVLFMSRPDAYHHRKEALALIERNLAVAPNDPDDIKARALVQTVDPLTRDEGMKVLKEYWSKGELTPDESFHLGMLIFGLGPSKIPESLRYFESAAKPRQGVTLEHIAGLFRVYAALDNLDLAEATLDRLKASGPRSWEATREEARLLQKKSQRALVKGDKEDARKFSEQARKLILQYPGHDLPDVIRVRTGPLLTELGFLADAETLYRKLLPGNHMPLAILYIHDKKSREAIQLAREHADKVPPVLTAQVMAGAVRVKRPGPEVEREVEQWMDQKIMTSTSKTELAGLIGARALLYDAQGQYDKSIAEYRRALSHGPDEKSTNNLAVLIALHEPSHVDEAIAMMTDLINLRGPVPTYLDSRALAYIIKGGEEQANKAIQDLEMALMQHARPVYMFHLAWAYELLQTRRADRDRKLDEARKIGISPDDVHPLERDRFQQLFSEIMN